MGLVPYGATLSAEQRMQIAMVTGHGERLAFGDMKTVPLEQGVAELHEISTDPVVFGIALGGALCRVVLDEWPHSSVLADLYRACGADEDVAAVNLEWHRQRPEYRERWRWAKSTGQGEAVT